MILSTSVPLLLSTERNVGMQILTRANLYFLFASLLGEGYKLDQLLRVADEINRIRASRRANMRGTKWDRFKKVLDSAWLGVRVAPKDQHKVTPKIFAGKSA